MFRAFIRKAGVCVLALGASAAVAEAGTVGYQVRIGGGKNAPIIRLINTSTEAGAEITGFKMTIGDTAYNFDYFWLKSSPTMSYSMLTPDEVNGGARFDSIEATFSDFTANKWFRIKTDIDIDSHDSKENWHKILYDFSGPYDIEDNAEFEVTFSTGHMLEGYLKDYSVEKKRVRYGRNLTLPSAPPPPPPAAVPLPAAVWSGFGLLGGLGGLKVARKNLKQLFC